MFVATPDAIYDNSDDDRRRLTRDDSRPMPIDDDDDDDDDAAPALASGEDRMVFMMSRCKCDQSMRVSMRV